MRRVPFALLLVVAMGAALAVGYWAGKGGLTLPAWVPPQVSSTLGLAPARSGMPPEGRSELKDYEFQVRDPQVKQGEAVVAVRLVNRPTGKPVPDAVIFARRLDMAPEGMPTMTAPLEPVPGEEPGPYRFKTNLIMEGGWQLSLAGKVQGESGTVQAKLVLTAVE